MKQIATATLLLCIFTAFSQSPPIQPIEERHGVSYWWWAIGVALAIGLGILAYMIIKKDPKRDSVR